jgi:hypothetical protein
MDNKPKIYAFCPAGCKWETVHKDDFEKSASLIAQSLDDGACNLQIGKEYKIFAPKDTDGKFTCTLTASYNAESVATGKVIENDYLDEYADSFVFRPLEMSVNADATEIKLVYELAGVRYKETISGTALSADGIVLTGATKVYIFNADATISGLTEGQIIELIDEKLGGVNTVLESILGV